MRLRWTQRALDEFEHAHDYIAKDDPRAAHEIAQRILDASRKLLDHPHIGRVGEDEDTREWRVQRTPYLLVYEINGDIIELLRVWHTKRERPAQED
ncbi:MAG: type II toxin-antitoxin system RelE/ParE family toxin [Candidatus Saccharimonadales bacterium]